MITLAIIEDHPDYRQGLAFLADNTSDMHTLWAHGTAAMALTEQEVPDVILLDINMPGLSGIEALPLIKRQWPDTRVIMLTIREDALAIISAILAGADGYILKRSHPDKILEAVRIVKEGGAALTPIVARQLLSLFPGRPTPPLDDPLTTRESQILDLIVRGHTNEAIGQKLFISTQTVRNHIKNMYRKMQVHSKAQAVAKAMQQHPG